MLGISDSRPTALALVSAAARGANSRYSAVIEDFATALEDSDTFADLSWAEANVVAEIIVAALTGGDHPAKLLRDRAGRDLRTRNRFLNQRKIRQALAAAATLYATRVYGYRASVVRYQSSPSPVAEPEERLREAKGRTHACRT